MKIDNRIFVPSAGPFVLLGIARLFWWLAGAEWSEPQAATIVCFAIGLFFWFFVNGLFV